MQQMMEFTQMCVLITKIIVAIKRISHHTDRQSLTSSAMTIQKKDHYSNEFYRSGKLDKHVCVSVSVETDNKLHFKM